MSLGRKEADPQADLLVIVGCDEGANMKRHKWSGIKARTSPGTRARIEAEGRRLSENVQPVTDVKSAERYPADDAPGARERANRDSEQG